MRNHLPIHPKMAQLVQEWKEVIKLRNTIWPKKFPPRVGSTTLLVMQSPVFWPEGISGSPGRRDSKSLMSSFLMPTGKNFTLLRRVKLEKIKCPLLGRWTQAPGCGCPARRSSSSSFTATAQSGQPGKIFYKWADKKKIFPLIRR